MNVKCPTCKEPIAARGDGVRCAICATPYHRSCWESQEKCALSTCESRQALAFSRRAAARVIVHAGRRAVRDVVATARERVSGKGAVLLFLLTCAVAGLGLGPILAGTHASARVDVEVVLATLFLILFFWIARLLHAGSPLEDDLTVKALEKSPVDYFRNLYGGLTGSRGEGGSGNGCGDLSGCDGCGSDLEGLVVLLVVVAALAVVVFVVVPVGAWLALEVVYPVLVLATYGVLYTALAQAVNGQEDLKGQLGACLRRAALFAALYTALVAVSGAAALRVWQEVKARRQAAPVPLLPAEEPRPR